jgi:hypothetical protein
MKIFPAIFAVALISLTTTPQTVLAGDEISQEQMSLLAQIAELKIELERLRAILAERVLESTTYVPYQAVLFTKPVEARYQVREGALQLEAGKEVRETDTQLFGLLREALGESALTKYLQEWRVFYDDEGDTDAFVEQIAGTDKFILNINRAGFDITKVSDQEALKELFVHEYAHMLLLTQKEVIGEYKETFWSLNDEKASWASPDQKESYFRFNKDRFVSSYSLNSVDEDMAEIFRAAVLQPDELALGVRHEKYVFLHDLAWVGEEIVRLQERLK